MKRMIFVMLMMLTVAISASAQASIKFDKTLINLGTFSEKDGTQTCVFTFTNVGNKGLAIDQAVASCGCTVPTYTKGVINPGDQGQVKVKYNGTGKFPGHFKKTITIRTNGTPEMVRLYIEGDMKQ